MSKKGAYGAIIASSAGSEPPAGYKAKFVYTVASGLSDYEIPLDASPVLSVTEIQAVNNRTSVVEIYVGEGVTTLGSYCFKQLFSDGFNQSPLESIYLPSTLSTIEIEALHNIARGSSNTDNSFTLIDFSAVTGDVTYTGSQYCMRLNRHITAGAGGVMAIPSGTMLKQYTFADWNNFEGRLQLRGAQSILDTNTFINFSTLSPTVPEIEFLQADPVGGVSTAWYAANCQTAKLYVNTSVYPLSFWKAALYVTTCNISHINDILVGDI